MAKVRDWNRDRGRIARQVARLLRVIEGRRTLPTLDALAGELGVSRRTVIRYLDAIEQAGWPVPRRSYSEAA